MSPRAPASPRANGPEDTMVAMLRPLAGQASAPDLIENVIGGVFGTLQCTRSTLIPGTDTKSVELERKSVVGGVVKHLLRLEASVARKGRPLHRTPSAPLVSKHGTASIGNSCIATPPVASPVQRAIGTTVQGLGSTSGLGQAARRLDSPPGVRRSVRFSSSTAAL